MDQCDWVSLEARLCIFYSKLTSPLQSTLIYTCTCSNGSDPTNIAAYQGTVPNFICESTFQQCRTANLGSDDCIPCGTLEPSDVEAVAAAMSGSIIGTTVESFQLSTPSAVVESPAIVQVLQTGPETTHISTSLQAARETDTVGSIATGPSSIGITSTQIPGVSSTDTTSPSPTRATSTTLSSPTLPSTPASAGLSSSFKIGIGLGVPLGAIIVAVTIGLLIYRHGRHKRIPRTGNHDSGISSARDQEARGAASRWKSGDMKELKHDIDDGGSEPMHNHRPKEIRHDIRAG